MMQIRSLAVCVVATSVWGAQAQPTRCNEDVHCPSGFYCVPEIFYCSECLSCDKFKRQSPAKPSCVKSFTDCGNCLEGLVPDVAGDICTSPSARTESPPWYIWLLIALTLVFIVIGFFACHLLKRRKRNTHTSLDLVPSGEAAKSQGVASAPPAQTPPAHTPPPPYWPQEPYNYSAAAAPPAEPLSERPSSHNGFPLHGYSEESEQPLVKHESGGWSGPRTTREGSQAARAFHKPSYVRNSRIHEDEDDCHLSDRDVDRGPELHSEETMPSAWTPAADTNGNTEGSGDAGSGSGVAGAVAGATSVGPRPFASLALRRPSRSDLSPPPPKLTRGDSNNNRDEEAGEGGSGAPRGHFSAAGAQIGGTNFIINIVNNNSV